MTIIQMTPEIETLMNQQRQTGKYDNDLAIIQEGLRLLAERERIYKGRFEELKREVMIGVEELRKGEGVDGEEIFVELEEDIQGIEAEMFSIKGENQ